MDSITSFVKETDAWSTVLFADPIATPLARLLSKTRIHPTAITFISLIPALGAFYFFWCGDGLSLLFGALCFQFSWILDCTDGKLARLTGKKTEFGRKLDPLVDFFRSNIALAAMVWGIFRQFGLTWFIITCAGLFLHYIIHLIAHYIPPAITMYPAAAVDKRIIPRVGKIYTAFDEQFFILFFGPLFAWLVPHFPVYMISAASFLYGITTLVIKIKIRPQNI
jgi:phosphatidylglycerophosphate synthase